MTQPESSNGMPIAVAALTAIGMLCLAQRMTPSLAVQRTPRSQGVEQRSSPQVADAMTLATGRAIYRRGVGRAPILPTAMLAPGEEPVPASVVACVGCHGRDGRGRPESGIVPADLTAESLGSARRDNEQKPDRPAYTPMLLKRAITQGVDAAGRPLSAAMPRFQMSVDDLGALVAYLPSVGREPEPGVTDSEIRVAVLGLPAEQARARQYFEQVAQEGGVYRRQLVVAKAGDPVFVGIGTAAAMDAVTPATDEETPWIDASPSQAASVAPVEPQRFYLLSSTQSGSYRQADLLRAEAMLLVEALRRAGRESTRERFVKALESVQRFDAGLGIPLSFARGQHIGAARPASASK